MGAPKEAGKIGQPDGAKNFLTGIRVLRWGGVTPFIPDMLLVSSDIAQPIPQM
jgi:hypothetical protein